MGSGGRGVKVEEAGGEGLGRKGKAAGEEKEESRRKKKGATGGGLSMTRREALIPEDPVGEGRDLATDRELVLPEESSRGICHSRSDHVQVVSADSEVNWRGLLYDEERWEDDDLRLDDLVRESEAGYTVRYIHG